MTATAGCPGTGPPDDDAPTPVVASAADELPSGGPNGYSYALPGGWVHLDPAPGRRAASVRRAVSGRVRREPRLAPHLAQLDRLLLQECAVAAAAGAERVSLLAEATESGIITAAVTFAVAEMSSRSAATRTPAARSVLDQLAAEHARARARDPSATMALVQLAGLDPPDAVRREWGDPAPGDGRPGSRSWQLVLPWPGRPRVGLLTLSSPADALWPRLGALFDACGQTFRWTG